MVNHHGENSCEVLAQKAMPWTSTDHVQGVDTFSTPKLAPATPMQAWQKPVHRHESPDMLPSLCLGRSSAELKAAYETLNVAHSLSTSAKFGLTASSTPSMSHSRVEPAIKGEEVQELQKENFLSFSLSQYEKNYDMATSLRNHMGPASSHRVCAPAGDSKMLSIESSASPQEGHAPANGPVALKSSSRASMIPKKFRLASNDLETTIKVDESELLFSPVPGEVANDAYKLYAELFPSTSIVTSLSSSTDLDAHTNSFLEPSDSMSKPPSGFCGHKSLVTWDRNALDDVPQEGGKKLKLTASDEGATSKKLLVPKQEPFFEEPYGTQELPCCGDAFPTADMNLTVKDCSGQCSPNASKIFSLSNSSHIQPKNLAMSLSSSNGYDHIAYNTGSCPLEVKPAVGLTLYTQSESAQLPKVGAWETPVQGNSSTDADWGKFLALSATPSGKTDAERLLPFQQRFKDLQVFLKQCDEADKNERLQGLQLLSAAARSGYAVELETRAVHLSLEEGKELKRMQLLNVLGRAAESNLEEAGATPHGPRLPVPGVSSPLAHAP